MKAFFRSCCRLTTGASFRLSTAAQSPAEWPTTKLAAGHSGGATHLAAAVQRALTTVRHRQQMERYGISYHKLNLARANTSPAATTGASPTPRPDTKRFKGRLLINNSTLG
ncbi:hypothetical protein IC235_21120 [Hymenobacter sp. BT664]|uniref:Uncharacterized protein n=1 Tax=Hymenobacter montanus TaxID=2771359 RepID=A0A927GLD0_9BACT|nr:hypothetical protein [Hymenobacter montanus]MBD2770395.1 hypothetical protein [Hymenobacter montanus]